MVVHSMLMQQKYFFAMSFSSFGSSYVGSVCSNEEQKMVSLWCTLLPHMLALYMMSQTQSARHEMAGCVFTTFLCSFLSNETMSRLKS